MTQVELVFDTGCPNAAQARAALAEALAQAGMPPSWKEWSRDDPAAAPRVRRFGSPAILVDGLDVGGMDAAEAATSCRVYPQADGTFGGVPPVQDVVRALRASQGGPPARKTPGGWRGLAATLPSGGIALLPAGACPACLPAFAGILGALGAGFLLRTAYLLPLASVFVGLALFPLACRARSRHGYGPFALGALAGTFLLAGKFAFASEPITYGSLALLFAAATWNAWPRRAALPGPCPECARQGTASQP